MCIIQKKGKGMFLLYVKYRAIQSELLKISLSTPKLQTEHTCTCVPTCIRVSYRGGPGMKLCPCIYTCGLSS